MGQLFVSLRGIIGGMILLTGGTGFIGQALARQLWESGRRLRLLLRPTVRTPRLPKGVPVEVAVASLNDLRGLRAALRGVEVVYHLASSEQAGHRADLQMVDVEGTRNLLEAAREVRLERFFFLSHLGAERASAYPVMKTKGIAEEDIRSSGVPYTIIRSAVVFGWKDHFTTTLARLIAASPFFMPLPGHGRTLLQPIWVEDLVACLTWALDEPGTVNRTYEVGGGEYLSFRQIVEAIMSVIRRPRWLVPLSFPFLRALTVTLEAVFPRFPTSGFWLDYLAVNRTCAIDSLPRFFGLLPARFKNRLDHLRGVHWGNEMWRYLFLRD